MRNFATWIKFDSTDLILPEKTIGLILPGLVRQHFLFYSTADIACFCHFHQYLLKNQGSNIFSAIGFNPCATYLLQLKNRFPNARTVLVFDDDLLGRVLDCKVVLAYLGKQLSFKLYKEQLMFSYKKQEFAILESIFSLHRFRTLTGIRSNHRTIKPKGAASFKYLLAQQIT